MVFGLVIEIGCELIVCMGGVVGCWVCVVVGFGDNGGDVLWVVMFL